MLGRLACGTLAALVLAVPAGAAVPPGNLLTNPGAEAGPGAPDGATILAPPGWVVAGEFTAVQYGAPNFLTAQDGAALNGGANFFAGGNQPQSEGSQTVDVSAAAAEIDAGSVSATLSGLLGGFSGQDDAATISATFQTAAGAPLGTPLQPPGVTAADRRSVTGLLPRSATAAVPPGTRSIVVRIAATRVAGSYNDGYADNVSLTLSTGEGPPPQFHKTVVAGVVSGTIRYRTPGARTFTTLGADRALPLGSILDTKHGVMELSSVPRAGGAPQTVQFYDGRFKVTQPGATTELRLTEPLASCRRASAARKKPRTRKLWGDGTGAFRVSGRYSSATVRGTKWLVQDSCAGTLTRVVRGTVSVRDGVRHKTVLVRAGRRYLAKPRP